MPLALWPHVPAGPRVEGSMKKALLVPEERRLLAKMALLAKEERTKRRLAVLPVARAAATSPRPEWAGAV